MARAIKTSTALRNILADALNIDRDAAESIRRELVKQTTAEDVAVEMIDYTKGFVPNSYRWSAPAKAVTVRIEGASVTVREWTYDRKRSNGAGNTFVVRAMKEGQTQGRVLRNI